MRSLTILAVALAFSSVSHAKVPGPFVAGIAGGYKVGFASNGQPLASTLSAVPGALSGEVLIRDLFNAPGPGGKTVPVTATRKIPWAGVARGAARALPYVAAGMVIYDLWDHLRVKPDGSGGIQADDGQATEQATQYQCSYGPKTNYGSSPLDACKPLMDAVGQGWQSDPYYTVSNPGWASGPTCSTSTANSGTCFGDWRRADGNAFLSVGWLKATVKRCPAYVDFFKVSHPAGYAQPGEDGKCPTGVYRPMTEDEATQLFQEKAPKTNAVDAVLEMLQKLDELKPEPAVELSGQPKVEMEPKVKTETDAEGNTKTTTTQEVHNITYQGNTYTWNTTTVTVNNDGTKTEETDPEPVVGATDPEMGDIPELYEQKYPDGLAGVWAAESAGMRGTPIFQFLASLNPNLGEGGCPVWSFPGGSVLGIQVGGDVSVPCYVWSALRVFVVIGALLLARRLIFGG